MAAPNYNVVLHHLSPDAKSAGVNYVNEPLMGVSAAQVRTLLQGLSEVAARSSIYEPAAPEIRIQTERSAFVVRTRYARLCLLGWENKLRGEEHTIGLILNTITGTVEETKAGAKGERRGSSSPWPGASSAESDPLLPTGADSTQATASNPPSGPAVTAGETRGWSRWAKIAGLGILIAGFNAATIGLIFFQTSESPTPKTQPLAEFESGAFLSKAAGEYQTGDQEGDRRLIIEPLGTLRVAKYGPGRAILQETIKTARGGSLNGRTVLVTSDPTTIEIKDANTVVYFGTTYRRRGR